jgi:hypothetical protein
VQVWASCADKSICALSPGSRSVLYSLSDQGGYVRYMFSNDWLLWAISSTGIKVLTGQCALEGAKLQVGGHKLGALVRHMPQC